MSADVSDAGNDAGAPRSSPRSSPGSSLGSTVGSSPDNCSDGGGNCSDALRDLERYLDGELPETELGSIREHLAACYPCADRASFEEQLRAIIRERCVEQTPPDLHVAIRQRLDTMTTSSSS